MEAMQMTHCLWAFKTAIILYLFPFFRQHDLSRGVGPELSERRVYLYTSPKNPMGMIFPIKSAKVLCDVEGLFGAFVLHADCGRGAEW